MPIRAQKGPTGWGFPGIIWFKKMPHLVEKDDRLVEQDLRFTEPLVGTHQGCFVIVCDFPESPRFCWSFNPSGLRPDRRGARRIDAWRDG